MSRQLVEKMLPLVSKDVGEALKAYVEYRRNLLLLQLTAVKPDNFLQLQGKLLELQELENASQRVKDLVKDVNNA